MYPCKGVKVAKSLGKCANCHLTPFLLALNLLQLMTVAVSTTFLNCQSKWICQYSLSTFSVTAMLSVGCINFLV